MEIKGNYLKKRRGSLWRKLMGRSILIEEEEEAEDSPLF